VANKMADKKKNASQQRTATSAPQPRSSEKEQEQQSKSVKAMTRERERENKPVRRESKQPSDASIRFRNNRIVRFARDAYQELRYKVTWPTFVEARNMTIVVLALSGAIGILLGIVDGGLTELFLKITGK
jgi:preprotein translocase SecE subunit